ncbi:hypothetical protein TIFTF001_019558 [Ficus carica]|uniref:Uncharacterized protein n=1 Tax=Ficus carica TaxID=3494 RepID=A0AA88AEJ8_FICCA|nr:hypothetical protein TIFTF001_019558 [Ficus carica]
MGAEHTNLNRTHVVFPSMTHLRTSRPTPSLQLAFSPTDLLQARLLAFDPQRTPSLVLPSVLLDLLHIR